MKTFKELYEACCAACEKRADIEEVKEPTGGLKDACWKGYTAVGMKMKNGRKVPNCVPANEESDRNQRLRDALEKVKKDFTKSHADKKTTIKMPTPAPKPEPTSVGGGTDYYPKAPYGRRYMIDELSKGTLRKYIDDAGDQESDVRHTLKRTEKSKHISAGAKDELKKLADRRKAGIRLASDKRGYYKGSDAKANFTHGAAKVPATEEAVLDEARNTYALYDDHPKFKEAHDEIHAAVKNAHLNPKAVVKAMRKHKQVGATDSASRDTIYDKVKKMHGKSVANWTRVLDEEFEQIDELSKTTVKSYADKARMDQNDTLGIALRKYSSPEEKAKYHCCKTG